MARWRGTKPRFNCRPDVVAEIGKTAGARRRSAFLVDLAKREIKRQRLLKALKDPEPIWRDEDHPEIGGDSDDWIRRMRMEFETRFQKLQRSSGSRVRARRNCLPHLNATK